MHRRVVFMILLAFASEQAAGVVLERDSKLWLQISALTWNSFTRDKSIDYKEAGDNKSGVEKETYLSSGGHIAIGARFADYRLVIWPSALSASYYFTPNFVSGFYLYLNNKSARNEFLRSARIDDTEEINYRVGPFVGYRFDLSESVDLSVFGYLTVNSYSEKDENTDASGDVDKFEQKQVSGFAQEYKATAAFWVTEKASLTSGLGYYSRKAKYKFVEERTDQGGTSQVEYDQEHGYVELYADLLGLHVRF